MKRVRIKIGSAIGVAGATASLVLTFSAIVLASSWFSWTTNGISDVGSHGGLAAMLFNLMPIGTSMSFVLFGLLTLWVSLPESFASRLGLAPFLIGMILYPLAGLFTVETSFTLHSIGDRKILDVASRFDFHRVRRGA